MRDLHLFRTAFVSCGIDKLTAKIIALHICQKPIVSNENQDEQQSDGKRNPNAATPENTQQRGLRTSPR